MFKQIWLAANRDADAGPGNEPLDSDFVNPVPPPSADGRARGRVAGEEERARRHLEAGRLEAAAAARAAAIKARCEAVADQHRSPRACKAPPLLSPPAARRTGAPPRAAATPPRAASRP
jgi:hypothetical protein